MTNLNDKERKVLSAICNDCDELDGWGFTRPSGMMVALARSLGNEFGNGSEWGNRIGGYITDLIKKNLIELDLREDEVWVSPEVFEQFC